MITEINYQQLFEEQREQNKQLQLLIQQLQQQIEQLLRAQFGQKTERKRKHKTPKPKQPAASSGDEEVAAGRSLPASFPRIDIHHDVSDAQKQCSHCQASLTEIKPLERELWAYRSGALYVKKHLRHRYACRSCQQTMITTTMPAQPVEKGVADSSLLTQVIIDKYQDHLPLYRQEQRWLRQGIALARQTLCEWAMASGSVISSSK